MQVHREGAMLKTWKTLAARAEVDQPKTSFPNQR